MIRTVAASLLVLWGGAAVAAGPFGGSVTDLRLSAEGGEPEWAATERGLFSYDDERWSRNAALEQAHLTAVARSGESLVVAVKYRGLLRSPDGGRTWGEPQQPPRGRYGHAPSDVLCLVSAAGGRLLLGTAGQGAFESADGGISWRLLDKGLEKAPPAAFHVSALLRREGSRPLLMGTDGEGLFAREDGLWQPIGRGLPEGLRVSALAASPHDPSYLVLGSFSNGLWTSRDAGQSWSQARKGRYRVVGTLAFATDGTLAAHFPDDGLVLVDPDGTVSRRPVSLRRRRVSALVAREGGGWLAGLEHDGVLELTSAGKPGRQRNRGLDATRIGALARGEEGDSLWCADANGVFYSPDGGSTWEPRDKGLIPAAGLNFLRWKGRLLLGTAGQGVWEWSAEEGLWKGVSEGLGTANTIFSLAADAGGQQLYVGTERGLRRRKGSEPWIALEVDLPGTAPRLVAVSPSVPGTLWAATPLTLGRSTDRGATWRELFPARAVALATEATSDGDRLWVLEQDGLKLVRGGEPTPFPARPASGEEFRSLAPGKEGVWAASTHGLWLLARDEFRRVWDEAGVNSLLPRDSGIVVGTDGRGVLVFRVR